MPERRTAKDRRQHIYLVFDDLVSGYTIRKVRLTPGSLKGAEQPLLPVSGEDSSDGEGAKHTLPEVFMSVEALRWSAMHFTSAFGTKIVALHPGESDTGYPILDVKDKSCIFGPVHFYAACPIFFPIGVDRADQELMDPETAGGMPQGGRFMYRLKIFSLRYDMNGDLKLKHCRVRCYSLPHETTINFVHQAPAAFWL
nr:unnamed protein product [Digitaria exilis]